MKLLVVGDSKVGKTTFIQQIADLCEDGHYRMTFHSPEGELTELEVIENQLPQFEFATGENRVVAITYLFDVTNKESFKKIKEM